MKGLCKGDVIISRQSIVGILQKPILLIIRRKGKHCEGKIYILTYGLAEEDTRWVTYFY